MVKEFTITIMEINFKETIKTIKEMEKEFNIIKMDKNFKENGEMVNLFLLAER